jgi:UDP-glucose 4-epimerase
MKNSQSTINNKPLTILVTGGAGYIGSFTVKELLDQKYDVVVLDSLENGHKEAVDPRAKLEIVDLNDSDATAKVFDKYKIDAVIDFAAYLAVGESMGDPKKYLKNNVENFAKLLDVMVCKRCKYIVKSSTAATYGDPLNESDFPLKEEYQKDFKPEKSNLLPGKWDGKDVVGEEFFQKIITFCEESFSNKPNLQLSSKEITKLRIPTSVYGLTKLLDEILLEKYNKSSNINSVSLRYFNVCGAAENGEIGEDHPEETHIVPIVLKNILSKTEFTLNGDDFNTKDGTPIRDYIHVIDLADGHIKALEYLMRTDQSEVFNLGNGIGYTVKEVIQSIENAIGQKAKYKVGSRRSGDPEKLIASPAKAENMLSWKAKYNLEDMVKTALKWHSSHLEGYGTKN